MRNVSFSIPTLRSSSKIDTPEIDFYLNVLISGKPLHYSLGMMMRKKVMMMVVVMIVMMKITKFMMTTK